MYSNPFHKQVSLLTCISKYLRNVTVSKIFKNSCPFAKWIHWDFQDWASLFLVNFLESNNLILTRESIIVKGINIYIFTGFCNAQICNPDQYLELGKSGILKCSFSKRSLLVWWYNSTEITDDPPLIKYKNSVKSGEGFTSGDFDVDSNGVLIINNVSLQHEHQFSAAYIPLNAEEAIIIEVNVIVIGEGKYYIHQCLYSMALAITFGLHARPQIIVYTLLYFIEETHQFEIHFSCLRWASMFMDNS